MIYNSLGIYISSFKDDLAAENEAIKAIIAALRIAQLDSAQVGNSATSEFSIDDGQSIIKGVNRDPRILQQTIDLLKQNLFENENRINGRVFRNVDAKNFGGRIC